MLSPIGGSPSLEVPPAEASAEAGGASPNPWRDASYDELVAAHVLRNPVFRSEYGQLLEHVAEGFFGHFVLADIVKAGLGAWQQTGKVPPPPVLLPLACSDGLPAAAYATVLDRLWALPLEGAGYAGARLVREVQKRLLAKLDEQRDAYLGNGSAHEYFKAVREIEALGHTRDSQLGLLTENMDELLSPRHKGVSTGFPMLDACLDNGGIGAGELFLVIGDPNVGKTCFLHHLAREAVFRQRLNTFVLSVETSFRNTKLRILRAELGWTRRQVWEDKIGFLRAVDSLGTPPLFVKFAPAGGLYNNASLEVDIDRVQQRIGEPIQFVIRDYGELMAAELAAWQEVRKSYLQFKSMLTRLQIPGGDACQRNRGKQISNFDLLKDADIGISLEEDMGSPGILRSRIERIREGEKASFTFRADRPTGRIEPYQVNPEDLECLD